MFIQAKIGGVVSQDDLKLDPCTTEDINRFYPPRRSSESQVEFLKKYQPMQCLNEAAGVKTTPQRQQGSQVQQDIAVNERVKPELTGQDVTLIGDGFNRHDDYRIFGFEIAPCEDDLDNDIICADNPEEELSKMDILIMYNTEQFDDENLTENPVLSNSVVAHYEMNPYLKYQIDSKVMKTHITEQRKLFYKSEAEFFEFQIGDYVQSFNTKQSAYVSGKIGLSPDRVLIVRSWPTIWEAFATVGGLILFLYIIGYALTLWYAVFERKVTTIMRIFYFAHAKQEHKIKNQNINFQVKTELGERNKMVRPSWWMLITCRGGAFLKQVN